MKKVYQYRYYGEDTNKNYPGDLSREQLISGDIFNETGKSSITHLGIQASPGTTFFLNNSYNPIQVGKTGIYEINLEGYGFITSIIFSYDTLDVVNEDNGIIIDIIYEGGTLS